MKHLRRFEERLDTKTYRKAGAELIRKFQAPRGKALIDYANEKEFGFYKMKYGNRNIMFEGQFTKPQVRFYCQPLIPPTQGDEFKVVCKDAEELVKFWLDGGELAVTMCFMFMPTEKTKAEQPSIFSSYKNANQFPMFSIKLKISDWYDGLDEWNTDQDTGERIEPGADANHLFENSFYPHLCIEKPDDRYCFGIFADRASALKFKRELPKLVEPYLPNVFDIISVVGGDSEHYERIAGLFDKISLNGLYDDSKYTVGAGDMSSIWFINNVVSR